MNIYKRLFAIAALCSMLATTISEAKYTIKEGYLTIGLDDSTPNDNYLSFTVVTGTPTKAQGFDISMYNYIATTLGLRAKFVAYADLGALETALADGKIDCYGGANFDIAQGSSDDADSVGAINYFNRCGVITSLKQFTSVTTLGQVDYRSLATYAYGIVFAPRTATGDNLPCALMQQVELAVNLAVASGAYACFASRNNANVDAAPVLVGKLTAPTPFFSTIYGTIPASTISGSTTTTRCNSCTRNQLPVTSCLVNYLLINKGEGVNIVDTTNL